MTRSGRAIVAALALALTATAPGHAETPEGLDRLAGLSQDATVGTNFARQLAGQGQLLEALAMLDRVLFAGPKAKPALLLHAGILCRLDDRDGGRAELAQLKPKDYPAYDWANTTAQCAAPAEPRR